MDFRAPWGTGWHQGQGQGQENISRPRTAIVPERKKLSKNEEEIAEGFRD